MLFGLLSLRGVGPLSQPRLENVQLATLCYCCAPHYYNSRDEEGIWLTVCASNKPSGWEYMVLVPNLLNKKLKGNKKYHAV